MGEKTLSVKVIGVNRVSHLNGIVSLHLSPPPTNIDMIPSRDRREVLEALHTIQSRRTSAHFFAAKGGGTRKPWLALEQATNYLV